MSRSEDLSALPPLIRQILAARGISDEDALTEYFRPDYRRLADPESLPGVCEAAEVILAAIAARRQILVFGDYDCDGVCATAILTRVISAISSRPCEAFIPDRLSEGYGMSDRAVARALDEFPDVGLVITVDNGINSVEQVAALKARGIGVIVTDHHLPGDELPAADALVDPKVAAPEELQNLCGAGVAYFLARRLVDVMRVHSGDSQCARGLGGALFVLAGLATVTDVMPLVGQNRILVAESLTHFAAWAPLGLRELFLRASRSAVQRLNSRDFGFLLGPRINAAGRLATAMEALELVLSDDREIARELARMVDAYNVKRKGIEQVMTEQALAQVVPGASAQVIDIPDGHPGVAGIVAARVLEKLQSESRGRAMPVCVIAGGRGSARATEGLNVRDALEACREHLGRFGGHAAAGGFSVLPGQTDAFRAALCDYCDVRYAAHVADATTLVADAWVEPRDLTLDFAEWIKAMEPFGESNPEPVIGLRGVRFSDIKPIGTEGQHLQFAVRGSGLRIVRWNAGELVEELRRNSARAYDLTATVEISEYGERHVELRLVALTASDVIC